MVGRLNGIMLYVYNISRVPGMEEGSSTGKIALGQRGRISTTAHEGERQPGQKQSEF